MNRTLREEIEVVHVGVGRVDRAQLWNTMRFLAGSRGVQFPRAPPREFAVVVRHGTSVVGGVGVVEHGPLMMFEWLVLSEVEPVNVRHAALEALMLYGMEIVDLSGKKPVMVVDRRRGGVGIRKMAERLGFAFRNEHLEVLEGP